MHSPLDILIKELQGNLPIEPRPYQILAEKAGLSELEVIEIVRQLKEQGKLRRVAAVLRHQKAGYRDNAMIAWKVPETQCDEMGNRLAAHPGVSHCYWRETPDDWSYTLFTMVHARSQEELQSIVKELSNAIGVDEYEIVESVRELKKTSVVFR